MRRTSGPARSGFTLVELIAATAVMAMLTTASFALLRTANNAWKLHRDDSNRRREAVAAMQHIMRRVRQAQRVTAISASNDASGALTLLTTAGTIAIWDHDSGTSRINYGTTTANNLLAAGIAEMTLLGLKANGSTQTTQTDLIHAVRCTLKYTLTRPAGATTETISCTSWLRSW